MFSELIGFTVYFDNTIQNEVSNIFRFGYFGGNEIEQLGFASLGNAEYVEFLFIILFICLDVEIVLLCISALKNVHTALRESIKRNGISLQEEEVLNHEQPHHQLTDYHVRSQDAEVITESGIHSAIHPLQVKSPINFFLIRTTEPYSEDSRDFNTIPKRLSAFSETENQSNLSTVKLVDISCSTVLAANGYCSGVAAGEEDDFDYLKCIMEPTDEYLTEYHLVLYREIMGTEQSEKEMSSQNVSNTNSSRDCVKNTFDDGLDPPEIIDWSELPVGEADPSAIPSWAVIPNWVFDRINTVQK